MKDLFIAGNWKMNKTVGEGVAYVEKLFPLIDGVKGVEVVICPPFTCLTALNQALKDSPVKLGAQNLFWESKGAFTGEISAAMLKDAGCTYVITGHSERRQVSGESNFIINKKLKTAFETGLIPIFCVGETLQERENHLAREVVKEQLTQGLKNIELSRATLIIAYEPVWAIGTGVNASCNDAQEMASFIRSCLMKLYNTNIADNAIILYGGSVNEHNITHFLNEEGIDGALVGGASLDAQSFARIVRLGKDE